MAIRLPLPPAPHLVPRSRRYRGCSEARGPGRPSPQTQASGSVRAGLTLAGVRAGPRRMRQVPGNGFPATARALRCYPVPRIRLYALGVGYHFRDDVADAEYLHDVTKAEVMQALAYARRWPQRIESKVDARVLQIFSRTAEGHAVAVVVIQVDHWDWLIYAARPLEVDENAEYTIWEAQQ
jgi:hypothetical protein